MAESVYRQLARLLREGGCRFSRGKARVATKSGSAQITQRHFAVPSNVRNAHTANAILKQAGLPKAF
jgi:hypothetical protein